MSEHFGAIILGSGQAGNPLASALAKAGKKTALIESKHVGGTCINEGCTPTKTMVASARIAHLARRGNDYGVYTGDVMVNPQVVRERKRAVVESFRSSSEKRLQSAENIELIYGRAEFIAPKAAKILLRDGGERELRADLVFINTGVRSATPKIEGIGNVMCYNNESIMELGEIPEHLMVLGGGYIGVEFTQMFRRFGSRVTLIQQGKQLLAREDEDVASAVAKILEEDGVRILLQAAAVSVHSGDGGVTLTVNVAGKEERFRGSHLLVATGRVPNTDALNLQVAGVETDAHGYIRVNERLETNVAGIYALGDVKGGPAFTHISYDDYRIVASNLLEGGTRTTSDRMVPYTVFIDPQLGRIGLTESEARIRGQNIRVAKMPCTSVARAIVLLRRMRRAAF